MEKSTRSTSFLPPIYNLDLFMYAQPSYLTQK